MTNIYIMKFNRIGWIQYVLRFHFRTFCLASPELSVLLVTGTGARFS